MKGQRMSVVLLGMLFAGCAGNMIWVKDGATQQQFNADQFDCKQKAYTMVGGYNPNNLGALAVSAPGFFNECMQGKGYRLEAQGPQTSMIWFHPYMDDDRRLQADNRECNGYDSGDAQRACRTAKGYTLMSQHDYEQLITDPARIMRTYYTHGEKVWYPLAPTKFGPFGRDYLACEGPTASPQAKTCMEARGYQLVYPSSVETIRMTKDNFIEEQARRDKVACDAPTLDQVKACMRGKGYTDKAPQSAQAGG